MPLKYAKQTNFHSFMESPASLIISRYLENSPKTTEKAKVGPKIDWDKLAKYILSGAGKTDHCQYLWTLIISEFNIGVGRTRTVEIK